MAKGNIILGTSTGSIGDITQTRRNGRQVQRVRVRTIANPRSKAQGAQRMRMAAITRFYSPLSSCLAKAFEGLNRSNSYSRYLSINARKAAAMNFAVPKDAQLCPVPVQISAGTMPTPVVTYAAADDGFTLAAPATTAPTTLGALSAALIAKYGLQNGDQVTFVGVFAGEVDEYSVEYHRIFLDTASTAPLPTLGLMMLEGKTSGLLITDDENRLAALGIVFSRWQAGKWRRSNSSMVCATPIYYYGDEAYETYIGEWSATAANAPEGSVYLDGEGGSQQAVTMTTEGSTNVEVVGVTYRTINGNVLALAEDANGDSYYVKCGNRKSDYFGKPLTKTLIAAEDAPAMPAEATAANTITFDPDASTESIRDAVFSLFYNGGVAPNIAADYFLTL